MARPTMSPLLKLLYSLFVFSSHVLAVSAVVGIDLGTEYFKAALVKPGIPLDIVLTKDSRRKEASAVAFKPPPNGPKPNEYPERAYGSDAVALAPRFPGDVYPNLKTLLGLPADAAVAAEYAARHPAMRLGAHPLRSTATFKSPTAFTPEEDAWMVEELLAMELQSIQKNAEAMAGSSVRSAVITVPVYYTAEEKRAVQLSAELAGLRVLSLISDGLAVGLHYATSRTFPNINQGGKPEHHMVFDMGAGSTKATVLKFQSRSVKDIGKFNKTVQEVQVLGSGWDRTLGGDALNYLIVDDMLARFAESPAAKKASVSAEGVRKHGRAIAKLTKDAERVRHVLSANTNTGASFEALYEDVDFKYRLERADFEKLAAEHISRVPVAIRAALDAAGLDVVDLDSVILHGGATRTPFVQRELEKIFGADKLRGNVNADEAAVFGAGFRAADISPSFRVKEIRVSDGVSYPAGIRYKNQNGKPHHQRIWSARSHLGGPAKEITLPNKEDFEVEFYQQVPQLAPATGADVEALTAVLTTKNLTATVAELKDKYSCEAGDVQFKISVKLNADNGEVDVTKATAQCEALINEKEGFVDGVKNLFGFGKKDDQKPLEGETESSSASASKKSKATKSAKASGSSSASSDAAASSDVADDHTPKKKLVVIPVKFELTKAGKPQLPASDVKASKDRLKAFEASDKARQLREEALNQLEGFTYKVRDLLEKDEFIVASTKEERTQLEKLSDEASEWLYGDGADAGREELQSRLKQLTDIVDPVQSRIDESKKRPALVTGLQDALKQSEKFVGDIKNTIAEYDAFKAAEAVRAAAAPPPEPSAADELNDLMDDDGSTAEAEAEKKPEEVGPVPPMYGKEDLTELEDLHHKIGSWLEDKLVAQGKLVATQNPVLTVRELTTWRAKLDKAGMDLTMKGVRNFESRNKKKPKAKKEKKEKKGDKPVKIELGKDGKMPTQEEIDELLRQFAAEQDDGAKAEEKKEEKPEKPEKPEVKHEEL